MSRRRTARLHERHGERERAIADGGKPGSALPHRAHAVDRKRIRGKSSGKTSRPALAERSEDRAARDRRSARARSRAQRRRRPRSRWSAPPRLAGGTFELRHGLREEDVVERRLVEASEATCSEAASSARTSSAELRPRHRAAGRHSPSSRARRAELPNVLRRSLGLVLDGRPTSTVGLPISAFKALGRVLGDDVAVVDDPDAIGERVRLLEGMRREKTVMPSSRARRATSSQSAVRLCRSRPVVGSSRNRIRGPWTSASARSRRRFMPPSTPLNRRSAASCRVRPS